VKGVTTNPILVQRAGGDPDVLLEALASFELGPLYYQLTAKDEKGMEQEARRVLDIVGESLVLKIPPTTSGYNFVHHYHDEFQCCITALFSPIQAMAAQEVGAQEVVVYVHRATQQRGNGVQLVKDVREILAYGNVSLLAASIKSSKEAGMAFLAGAQHVTAGLSVLENLIKDEFSLQALNQFNRDGIGI